MNREKELLFYQCDLRGTLDYQLAKAREAIGLLTAQELDPLCEKDLWQRLEHEFVVKPLQIDRNGITHDGPHEIEIEPRGDRDFFYGEGHKIKAIEVTFIVLFTGDPALFKCRPSTWSTNIPRGEVDGQECHLTIRDLQKDVKRVKQELNRQLQAIDEYISWQASDISAYNKKLRDEMTQAITKRRHEVAQTATFADELGIPARKR